MSNAISKLWSSRAARCVKIYVLLSMVMSILTVTASDLLVTDASAYPCTGGPRVPEGCTMGEVPEIPTLMLPLFLLVSAGSFYYVRRRSLRVSFS